MNEEIKDKWLIALRSEHYDQFMGALQGATVKGIGYCCLGVLCDAVPEVAELVSDHALDISWRTGNELTPQALTFVHLTIEQQIALVKMNDSGVSFNDIADYIEAFL